MTPFYLHGLPGGPEELSLAGSPNALPCLDRSGGDDAIVARLAGAGPLHLIGFSLGAALALRLAARLPVAQLTLISPAAPLTLGNFLPDMAGAPVFRAARRPWLLRALTALQAAGFQNAPARSLQALFHNAPAADLALLSAENQRLLLTAYRRCVGQDRAKYLAELIRYVQPWDDVLPRISAPVTLWYGADDTWSPPAMAQALARALPQTRLHLLPQMGHYSTLCHALPLTHPPQNGAGHGS